MRVVRRSISTRTPYDVSESPPQSRGFQGDQSQYRHTSYKLFFRFLPTMVFSATVCIPNRRFPWSTIPSLGFGKFLCLAGAVIRYISHIFGVLPVLTSAFSWTRGTGFMAPINIVADDVRTFIAKEMALDSVIQHHSS
jgi:hypothetical protein